MPREVWSFLEACYDVFRILRLAFPNGRILIFLEDLLYFAVAAVASFSFIVLANGGLLRAFILIGELLGAILYFFSLSLLIMGAAKQIIRAIHALFRFLFRLTLLPLLRLGKWLAGKMLAAARFCRSRVKISFFTAKNHLKPPAEIVYNVPISPVSASDPDRGDWVNAAKRKGRKWPWQRKKQKNH